MDTSRRELRGAGPVTYLPRLHLLASSEDTIDVVVGVFRVEGERTRERFPGEVGEQLRIRTNMCT